jgi:hypothetical protein
MLWCASIIDITLLLIQVQTITITLSNTPVAACCLHTLNEQFFSYNTRNVHGPNSHRKSPCEVGSFLSGSLDGTSVYPMLGGTRATQSFPS